MHPVASTTLYLSFGPPCGTGGKAWYIVSVIGDDDLLARTSILLDGQTRLMASDAGPDDGSFDCSYNPTLAYNHSQGRFWSNNILFSVPPAIPVSRVVHVPRTGSSCVVAGPKMPRAGRPVSLSASLVNHYHSPLDVSEAP
jgi:hypothetical protein